VGATNVNGGNLVVNNGQLTSPINVSGVGSALGGNGTIVGDVTLTNSGVVSPGIANAVSNLATLTITGNLIWNVAASTVPWHLSTTGSTSDLLVVSGASAGNVTNPGSSPATLTFDFQDTGYYDGTDPEIYTLITSTNSMTNAGFSLSQFQAINVLAHDQGEAYGQSYFMFNSGATASSLWSCPSLRCGVCWRAARCFALAGLRRKRNIKA